jgi:hypothetical protein
LHQAPFTPAAFDVETGKGHVRVISQRGLDASISLFRRTGVKVDCNAIAYGRQLPGLLNNRVPILVTEKKKAIFAVKRPLCSSLPTSIAVLT